VIEGGALRAYFLDTYYAKRLGLAPTAGSSTNLKFAPSRADGFEQMLEDMPSGLAVTGFLVWDGYFFRKSLSHYMEASSIYDAGIEKIKTHLPDIPPGSRLILIDFPDKILRPRNTLQENPTRYRILVYRNALPYHLFLLYKNQNFTVTLVRLSPPNGDNPEPMGTPSSPDEVAKLAAGSQNMICRYLPGNPGDFVIEQNGPGAFQQARPRP